MAVVAMAVVEKVGAVMAAGDGDVSGEKIRTRQYAGSGLLLEAQLQRGLRSPHYIGSSTAQQPDPGERFGLLRVSRVLYLVEDHSAEGAGSSLCCLLV